MKNHTAFVVPDSSKRGCLATEGDYCFENYSKGFNLAGVVAFLCGAVAYFAVYDPINYTAKNVLFNIFTDTGFSCIVAAAVYFGLSKIPAVGSYVLREKN